MAVNLNWDEVGGYVFLASREGQPAIAATEEVAGQLEEIGYLRVSSLEYSVLQVLEWLECGGVTPEGITWQVTRLRAHELDYRGGDKWRQSSAI